MAGGACPPVSALSENMELRGIREVEAGRRWMGRMPGGEDLTAGIVAFCGETGIHTAVFSVMGTVAAYTIGAFDPVQQVYVTENETAAFDIVACRGNVSTKDSGLFVRAHICDDYYTNIGDAPPALTADGFEQFRGAPEVRDPPAHGFLEILRNVDHPRFPVPGLGEIERGVLEGVVRSAAAVRLSAAALHFNQASVRQPLGPAEQLVELASQSALLGGKRRWTGLFHGGGALILQKVSDCKKKIRIRRRRKCSLLRGCPEMPGALDFQRLGNPEFKSFGTAAGRES